MLFGMIPTQVRNDTRSYLKGFKSQADIFIFRQINIAKYQIHYIFFKYISYQLKPEKRKQQILIKAKIYTKLGLFQKWLYPTSGLQK